MCTVYFVGVLFAVCNCSTIGFMFFFDFVLLGVFVGCLINCVIYVCSDFCLFEFCGIGGRSG